MTQQNNKPSTASISLRVLARLLAYPDAELRSQLSDMDAALQAEQALAPQRLNELVALIRTLQHGNALENEAEYVQLFDRGRATSLHLFEHVHGDSRDRGPAMVDLVQTYEKAGLFLAPGELPGIAEMAGSHAGQFDGYPVLVGNHLKCAGGKIAGKSGAADGNAQGLMGCVGSHVVLPLSVKDQQRFPVQRARFPEAGIQHKLSGAARARRPRGHPHPAWDLVHHGPQQHLGRGDGHRFREQDRAPQSGRGEHPRRRE